MRFLINYRKKKRKLDKPENLPEPRVDFDQQTTGPAETNKPLDTSAKCLKAAACLQEKKAADIVILNLPEDSSVTEAMVIATASGARHAKALTDHVLDLCKKNHIPFLGVEGYINAQWILIDLNDVLVHIFLEETRRFYNLEGLWSEGNVVPFTT